MSTKNLRCRGPSANRSFPGRLTPPGAARLRCKRRNHKPVETPLDGLLRNAIAGADDAPARTWLTALAGGESAQSGHQ
jgi:hypothetical protein